MPLFRMVSFVFLMDGKSPEYTWVSSLASGDTTVLLSSHVLLPLLLLFVLVVLLLLIPIQLLVQIARHLVQRVPSCVLLSSLL